MKIVEIKSGVFLVDFPGPSSNVVYFKTPEGVILMDTTSTTEEMQAVLDLAGLSPADIILLINTHGDHDHYGGNSLFSCPILAHEITYQRMAAANCDANEMPTETFSGGNKSLSISGLEIELIFKGGHKPDLTILWLPPQKVLLPSDLIFENCYPYIIGSDIPVWIDALRSLSDFDADVIFPGHGTLCNQETIDSLIDYMKTSWESTAAHIEHGDTLENILTDPTLPRPEGWEREFLFETNIETIYEQIRAKQVP